MKHKLTPQQYGILATVMFTAAIGDTLLSHGMAQVGPVDVHHLSLLFMAMKNLWVISGILMLIGFFASYLTALSWADLTFVLPATSFSYVVVAVLSHFWLHEHISIARWAGILLIVGGVGFVSQGPALTEHPPAAALAEEIVDSPKPKKASAAALSEVSR
jgi:drug/metabolite transporter (DMT)-like permease